MVQGTEFDPVSVIDNCGVASIINDYNNSSSLANTTIAEGNTTIVWTVTDINGNIDSCSFNVFIETYVGFNTPIRLTANIYPNPTTGKVFLDFADNHVNQIIVTDITGKQLILKTEVKQIEILDLSNYETGIYLIIIQSDREIITSKIVLE